MGLRQRPNWPYCKHSTEVTFHDHENSYDIFFLTMFIKYIVDVFFKKKKKDQQRVLVDGSAVLW